jgi:hypothetical protein
MLCLTASPSLTVFSDTTYLNTRLTSNCTSSITDLMPLAPIPHAVRLDQPRAALLAVVVPDGHEAAASWADAGAHLPERQ